MSTAEATVNDCSTMFRALAGGRNWNDSVQRGIDRASRLVGVSRSQGKRLWYGDLSSVPAHVYLQVQQKYEALCEAEERKANIQRQILKSRIERGFDAVAESETSERDVLGGRSVLSRR
ncbi:hypothetical protein QMT40_001810 [Parvibaculaceae bacterium PLY_AMNH_Bact1]|nr:hypothetical protein QMT40_001810 [Parvibaculaceae bacterium PLY_AMNH_Bact1]